MRHFSTLNATFSENTLFAGQLRDGSLNEWLAAMVSPPIGVQLQAIQVPPGACDKLVQRRAIPMQPRGLALSTPSPHEITQLLQAWSDGDPASLEKLTPLVYKELRRLAKHYMARERPGHTLQTTALVNEAYLKLVDSTRMNWHNRAHFFAVSAQLMRRVLVDFARSRRSLKRGADAGLISLEEAPVVSSNPSRDLVALHDALTALAVLDPRKSQVVELRFRRSAERLGRHCDQRLEAGQAMASARTGWR